MSFEVVARHKTLVQLPYISVDGAPSPLLLLQTVGPIRVARLAQQLVRRHLGTFQRIHSRWELQAHAAQARGAGATPRLRACVDDRLIIRGHPTDRATAPTKGLRNEWELARRSIVSPRTRSRRSRWSETSSTTTPSDRTQYDSAAAGTPARLDHVLSGPVAQRSATPPPGQETRVALGGLPENQQQ